MVASVVALATTGLGYVSAAKPPYQSTLCLLLPACSAGIVSSTARGSSLGEGGSYFCTGGLASPMTLPAPEARLRSLVTALRRRAPPCIAPSNADRGGGSPAAAPLYGTSQPRWRTRTGRVEDLTVLAEKQQVP